jgi:hypothetical protein
MFQGASFSTDKIIGYPREEVKENRWLKIVIHHDSHKKEKE